MMFFSGLMFMFSRMIKIFNNERNWLAKNVNSAYKGNEQCIKEENEEDRIFKLCEEIYDLEYKVCNEKSEEKNEENKRKLVEKYENLKKTIRNKRKIDIDYEFNGQHLAGCKQISSVYKFRYDMLKQ